MAKKVLLASLSTNRGEGDEKKKVRYEAGSVVNLTEDETALLDKLTMQTGRPHYRDPVNENATEDEPDMADPEDAFLGESKPMEKKDVGELKAYLDYHSVPYESSDLKADLLSKAQTHEKDGGL